MTRLLAFLAWVLSPLPVPAHPIDDQLWENFE